MNMYKVLINWNDNVKDYVTVTWFNGDKAIKTISYNKPYDVSDYTFSWKQGLYEYQHQLLQECFGDEIIISDL